MGLYATNIIILKKHYDPIQLYKGNSGRPTQMGKYISRRLWTLVNNTPIEERDLILSDPQFMKNFLLSKNNTIKYDFDRIDVRGEIAYLYVIDMDKMRFYCYNVYHRGYAMRRYLGHRRYHYLSFEEIVSWEPVFDYPFGANVRQWQFKHYKKGFKRGGQRKRYHRKKWKRKRGPKRTRKYKRCYRNLPPNSIYKSKLIPDRRHLYTYKKLSAADKRETYASIHEWGKTLLNDIVEGKEPKKIVKRKYGHGKKNHKEERNKLLKDIRENLFFNAKDYDDLPRIY